ncbi:MAG: beta galactosidase jelly roll domain-containing protein, partial [Bacteroidota bacterium]|nr:beta galactosidase jelly roll domain-containing protein [Bacteroidota bacterium]
MRIFRLFLLLISLSLSRFGLAQDSPRRHMNFDNDWRFHLGNASDPARDFNYSIRTIFAKSGDASGTAIDPRFDDHGWRSLNLPHDWVVELPFADVNNPDVKSHGYKPVGGLFPATSIGWYRKHFRVNRADSGSRFQLQFDGIYRNARIWLNGFYVGNIMSGYIGNSYDVTDYLNYTGDNVLVVRVDATQYEGWFYEGAGIYRHVWLNQYDNVHLADGGQYIYSTLKGENAEVTAEATVDNQGTSLSHCSVYSYLTDRDGKVLVSTREQPLEVEAGGSGMLKQTLSLKNPRLWGIDDPYLYR